jgi:hypothetical protein
MYSIEVHINPNFIPGDHDAALKWIVQNKSFSVALHVPFVNAAR